MCFIQETDRRTLENQNGSARCIVDDGSLEQTKWQRCIVDLACNTDASTFNAFVTMTKQF
jgi:hypothetical protein